MTQAKITLEIDGRSVQVEAGATVMEAATQLGIFVPHFCWHRKLSIAANCRMCLVQVEKAPKPLPACATPATEGMKVFTHSEAAVGAQKGVMEFLLINHPLDCPICDQGGECQLQDLAVGYGGSASRYQEEKRVVVNKNLGPLISTDMTRCIHCTRCVRFGQEIAGVMELGMAGRGEHSEILTFVGRTVDSELSGNVIDLCPVGALTSRPFRYSARSWELARRRSVSAHDALGANLVVQVKQERVMRVLPLENEAVNECWLSDRDRFAYEGLASEDRLVRPMLRRGGAWAEAGWTEALEATAAGLGEAIARHGPDALASLLSPQLTLEELHLAAKLVRGLGSELVDCRLGRADFRGGAGAEWLGMEVAALAGLGAVLLVGSTLRKEQPLLAARLRRAAGRGLALHVVHAVDDDLLMPVANRLVARPSALARELLGVARALAEARGLPLAEAFARAAEGPAPGEKARRIAASLAHASGSAVLLGHYAARHPDAALLEAVAREIGRLSGATVGFLPEGANAVGGWLAGAVASGAGRDARAMLAEPRRAWLLAGVEPERDLPDPALATRALSQAPFVVSLAAYRGAATEFAHVLLPIAPFTETGGTFVNLEGRVQSFHAVVQPLGEARPAWKVLRMLGRMLGLAGFDAETLEDVRRDIAPDLQAWAHSGLARGVPRPAVAFAPRAAPAALERIAEMPIYAGDPIVRRAPSLQKTADARAAATARFHPATLAALGLAPGARVRVRQGGGEALVAAAAEPAVPEGCVRLALGMAETATLGEGEVTVERVDAERAA